MILRQWDQMPGYFRSSKTYFILYNDHCKKGLHERKLVLHRNPREHLEWRLEVYPCCTHYCMSLSELTRTEKTRVLQQMQEATMGEQLSPQEICSSIRLML